MSRAERFEDEKERIIESCFSKRDADGSGQYLRTKEVSLVAVLIRPLEQLPSPTSLIFESLKMLPIRPVLPQVNLRKATRNPE